MFGSVCLASLVNSFKLDHAYTACWWLFSVRDPNLYFPAGPVWLTCIWNQLFLFEDPGYIYPPTVVVVFVLINQVAPDPDP